eukprot:Nk52_evm59s352 gene=Nk52_evmTU59s352
MSLLTFQVVSLAVTFSLGLSSLVPITVNRAVVPSPGKDLFFSSMECFVAGVFIAVGLLDMLNDANENLDSGLESFPRIRRSSVGGEEIVHVDSVTVGGGSCGYSRGAKRTCSDMETGNERRCEEELIHQMGRENDIEAFPEAVCEDKADQLRMGQRDEIDLKFLAITILVVMISQSIMEGLAIGFVSENSDGWSLLFAVACHKGFAALAIGSSLSATNYSFTKQMLYAFCFVMASPLGVSIGMVVQKFASSVDTVSGIFFGLAAGNFVYISAILFRENMHSHQVLKLTCGLVGFGGIAVGIYYVG